MVLLHWCLLRHSSLRTPNTLPLWLQLWQNTGDKNVWSWMLKTNTFYRMIWCSITRKGHIKSQYLQIIMILATLWVTLSPSKPQIYSSHGLCVYVHTSNSELVVENKSVCGDTTWCNWSVQSLVCLVELSVKDFVNTLKRINSFQTGDQRQNIHTL